VPVIVSVAVPIVAVAAAVTVKLLVSVVLAGLNEGVTPLGTPDTDRLTGLLKPFCAATVIVTEPLVPWIIVKPGDEAESVKFGAPAGQLLTRLAALMVPIPVAKSQPAFVP
jgi:hypothetical protein